MDEVAENSDALMERYLEGEEISHDEIVARARRTAPTTATSSRSPAASRPRNLGTDRLLDAIVDDLPSPVKHGGLELEEHDARAGRGRRDLFAYVFKTRADPFAGRINLFRVYQGIDDARHAGAQHARPQRRSASASCSVPQGKEIEHADAFGAGDIGAVAKLKETQRRATGSTGKPVDTMPAIKLPAPVMAFAIEPKSKGDEDKVFTALRRLQEEDPTIDLHRDAQTGEQIVAGLSQVHVEVIVDRMKRPLRRRGRAEAAARALPGDDPQAGQGPRPPQEADRRPRPVRRLPHRDRAARRTARSSSSSTRSRAA